jgi:hypothetical protein
MNEAELILANQAEFFKYLKSRFTLIHTSNIFFRDFHYGVMSYLADHGKKLRYQEAEQVASRVAATFESSGILTRIDFQSWKLNYPEFALPRVEKVVEKKAS